MISYFICYPSQHESFYVVACPCHVTVRGLQDYVHLSRIELSTAVRKWTVYLVCVFFLYKKTMHVVCGQKVLGYF